MAFSHLYSTINIVRSPLWGRAAESMSEDHFLNRVQFLEQMLQIKVKSPNCTVALCSLQRRSCSLPWSTSEPVDSRRISQLHTPSVSRNRHLSNSSIGNAWECWSQRDLLDDTRLLRSDQQNTSSREYYRLLVPFGFGHSMARGILSTLRRNFLSQHNLTIPFLYLW